MMNAIGENKTVAARSGEEINIAELNEFLKFHSVDMQPISEVEQFPGGYSNLTYLLKTIDKSYVLRRPPAGAKEIKGGHDMAREFRILKAIENTGFQQIPKPVFLSESENFLGQPFYIMEKVEGIVLRASDAGKLTAGYSPTIFKSISENLCDTLVDLHAININKTGLITIGKPDGYVERQVNGWYKRYQHSQTDDLPEIDNLAEWLQKNKPESQPPTLIHNDFKYDNVVLNPAKLSEIRAILDWEMTTVGDPLMDLGTTLSYWSEISDGDFEKTFNLSWLPDNLTRQEFAERYASKSGRKISQILYYYVFGLFKNSIVIQQIYARYQKGLTQDPRFKHLLSGVKRLSAKAISSIEKQQML